MNHSFYTARYFNDTTGTTVFVFFDANRSHLDAIQSDLDSFFYRCYNEGFTAELAESFMKTVPVKSAYTRSNRILDITTKNSFLKNLCESNILVHSIWTIIVGTTLVVYHPDISAAKQVCENLRKMFPFEISMVTHEEPSKCFQRHSLGAASVHVQASYPSLAVLDLSLMVFNGPLCPSDSFFFSLFKDMIYVGDSSTASLAYSNLCRYLNKVKTHGLSISKAEDITKLGYSASDIPAIRYLAVSLSHIVANRVVLLDNVDRAVFGFATGPVEN